MWKRPIVSWLKQRWRNVVQLVIVQPKLRGGSETSICVSALWCCRCIFWRGSRVLKINSTDLTTFKDFFLQLGLIHYVEKWSYTELCIWIIVIECNLRESDFAKYSVRENVFQPQICHRGCRISAQQKMFFTLLVWKKLWLSVKRFRWKGNKIGALPYNVIPPPELFTWLFSPHS